MSFTENDRKLRSKNGKSFPSEGVYGGPPYRASIADALRAEFGSAQSAVKRIARLTAANERAVRNWLDGKNGPSGESLVTLMKHSDAVFGVVLGLCQRPRAADAGLMELRVHLVAALIAIDRVQMESG